MDTTPWHALVALGTKGGDPLVNGDRLARGVHLLWSWRPELGFPIGGYDVWRRVHRPPGWFCLDLDTHMSIPDNGGEWEVLSFRLVANPGPVVHQADGCGKRYALVLPPLPPDPRVSPIRVLEVWSPVESAAVRGIGLGEPPVVEVLAAGSMVVATQPAQANDEGWSFEIWADGIIAVRLAARSLRLCEVCFGVPHAPDGWEKLTNRPILLPVVDPQTENAAAQIHERRVTRRIAGARLSSTLAADRRQRLADGFSDEVRELTEHMLREGRAAFVPSAATASAGARQAPRLGFGTAAAVALAGIDSDVARMLGLYWHDDVDSGLWDYMVVAHHGGVRYPSRLVTFEGLTVGAVAHPMIVHKGLTFLSSGGMDVRLGAGGGQTLYLEAPRPSTVAGITLKQAVPAVALHFAGTGAGAFTAWRNRANVASAVTLGGPVTLEHAGGIDAVSWSGGSVELASVELFREVGVVGDLSAYAWHCAPALPTPVGALTIVEARGASESPRLNLDGTIEPFAAVAGLDWQPATEVRNVGTPVRVHVARSGRGNGETPAADGPFQIQNLDRPALALTPPDGSDRPWPGPDVPRLWIDRGLRPGWYAWRVRGIDVFGRLGAWSPERLVEARRSAVPPPPESVTARYLDPADPYLPPDDRALASADGAGLLVEWTWTAERRVRAPQVEPAGEFRIYVRRGDPNLLSGRVLTATDLGGRSRLETDVRLAGPANGLAGELARIGRASFTITAHGAGADAWIEVAHLAAPAERPAPGPLTIRVSEGSTRYVDPTDPLSYDLRLHVQAIGELVTLTGRIVRADTTDSIARIALDASLPDTAAAAVPGFFVSRGIAFPVVQQAPGSPRLDVQAVTQPDGSIATPRQGDTGTLWAGARYRAWLPGAQLRPRASEGLALGLVAVTTSDGDPAVADQPQWSDGAHGSLGGRSGSESRGSRVARIHVPHRTPPPPVVVSRPPEVDGDIPADQAEPADWYGRARYTLSFGTVEGATGYRVLRASVSALFTRDRYLRQSGQPPYGAGPFAAGDGSQSWLAENFADLTVGDLTADLATHPAASRIVDAWRAWAEWYYPPLRNVQVMDLADLDGNRDAFQPAHAGTITGSPYRDTIDGRGLGRFVYRVRAVDASGNAADWSPTFPVVEVRDVTPPKTPTVVKALAADNAAGLMWRAASEPDVAEYRVWRADTPAALDDVRRLPPTAVVAAAPGAATAEHLDRDLRGLTTYYYRVAAVDVAGNVSAPTPVYPIRVPDLTPPGAPEWERAAWVLVDTTGRLHPYRRRASTDLQPAVALQWLAEEPGLVSAVERRSGFERTFRTIASGLGPLEASDPARDAARRFIYVDTTAAATSRSEYRIRLTDPAGNTNLRDLVAIAVDAPGEGGP